MIALQALAWEDGGMAHPVRPCVACKVFDDHPRHVVVDPLNPGNEELMHMDCCRDTRGCGVCAAQLAGADGKTGDDLRIHLESLAAKQVAHEEGDHPFGAVRLDVI